MVDECCLISKVCRKECRYSASSFGEVESVEVTCDIYIYMMSGWECGRTDVASQAALGVSQHFPVGFKRVANTTTEGKLKHCRGSGQVI